MCDDDSIIFAGKKRAKIDYPVAKSHTYSQSFSSAYSLDYPFHDDILYKVMRFYSWTHLIKFRLTSKQFDRIVLQRLRLVREIDSVDVFRMKRLNASRVLNDRFLNFLHFIAKFCPFLRFLNFQGKLTFSVDHWNVLLRCASLAELCFHDVCFNLYEFCQFLKQLPKLSLLSIDNCSSFRIPAGGHFSKDEIKEFNQAVNVELGECVQHLKLKFLSISNNHAIFEDFFTKLNVELLQTLMLENVLFGSEYLVDVLKVAKHLTTLTLTSARSTASKKFGVSDAILNAISDLPNLKHLELSGHLKSSYSLVVQAEIISNCHRLETLVLRCSTMAKNRFIETLANSQIAAQLKSLDLFGHRISKDVLANQLCLRFTGLKTLDISCDYYPLTVNSTVLQNMAANLTRIEVLNLGHLRGIHSEDILLLNPMTNLKVFKLSISYLSEEDFVEFGSAHPTLEHFHVSVNRKSVSSAAFRAFQSYTPQMRHFHLMPSRIGDDGLTQLATCWPRLQWICLSVSHVSNAGIQSLVDSCLTLKTIHTWQNDIDLSLIAIPKFRLIEIHCFHEY